MHKNSWKLLSGFFLILSLFSNQPVDAQGCIKQWHSQGPIADLQMGDSTAIHGRVMAVSGPTGGSTSPGQVFVYRRAVDSRLFVHEATLTSDDGNPGDHFGRALAMFEDVIVVGAFSDDDGRGSVFVYRYDGNSWVREQKLTAGDGAIDDWFGFSVDIEKNFVIVGAVRDQHPETGEDWTGSAYVFWHDGISWHQDGYLSYPFSQGAGSSQGASVGISQTSSGWQAAVGAPTFGLTSSMGGVFLYDRIGSGGWEIHDPPGLARHDAGSPDFCGGGFGESLDFDGNAIIVGAPLDDCEVRSNAGAAYTYLYDGTHWHEEQKFTAQESSEHGNYGPNDFGRSVSMDGDVALIGSPFDRAYGREAAGAAYTFKRIDGIWTEMWRLTDSVGFRDEQLFGKSVAMDGSVGVIGIPLDDYNDTLDSGAVQVVDVDLIRSSFSNYGEGWAGTQGIPTLEVTSHPTLGDSLDLWITNSRGEDTEATLYLGLEPAEVQTDLGGTLNLIPFSSFPLLVPSSGLSIRENLPCDPALAGFTLYLQVMEVDPGASHGYSFTDGLVLTFGDYY